MPSNVSIHDDGGTACRKTQTRLRLLLPGREPLDLVRFVGEGALCRRYPQSHNRQG